MTNDQQPTKRASTRNLIFYFIVRYKHDHDGNAPSAQQIADACFLSSRSTVYYHLGRLALENRIIISGTCQIEIVDKAER